MYWKDAQTTLLKTLFDYERIGLITDVDGTISPIVDQPDKAQVTPQNHNLLQQLHTQLTFVGVISGRSAEDVAQRVGIEGLVYIGNHGLEHWEDGILTPSPQVAKFRPALESALIALKAHQVDGLFIEDKQATLSIHYRNVANPTHFAQEFTPIIQRIASDNNLQHFQGRMIFELRPPLDIHKGTAFRDLIESHNLQAALYLGDDTTDVDALKMARALRQHNQCYALAIGVESDDTPDPVRDNADLLVSGIPDVESFFAWLLNASKASSS